MTCFFQYTRSQNISMLFRVMKIKPVCYITNESIIFLTKSGGVNHVIVKEGDWIIVIDGQFYQELEYLPQLKKYHGKEGFKLIGANVSWHG